MDTRSDEFFKLIKTLELFEVKYLIIGGFAVNHYGYNRTTGDLDIYLKDTKENRRNLIRALKEMEYGEFDMLMDLPIVAGYCEILMDSGFYIDLMTDVPGLEQKSFDHYFDMADLVDMKDFKIRFLHYNQLIANKEATGRPKDKLDIEELKKIRGDR